jgi:two-component system KDP operon response regulator KdpE
LPQEPHKILIVDDEPALRRALSAALAAVGFQVQEASCGEEAVEALTRRARSLVLLDINMPGMGGLEACRRLRAVSRDVGIVMVTVRDSEDDKVRALEAGADDFVTKPYRLRELVARLRAVLRRVESHHQPDTAILRAGDLELDLGRRLLRKSGSEVHLSPTEFDLIAYLFSHQGNPVSRVELLRAVWGPEYGGELEYLRSYIRMLRKKIEDDPAKPEYILTEPWLGYRFRNPSEPGAAPVALGESV